MVDQVSPVPSGAPLAAVSGAQIEKLPALAAAGRILAWRTALESISTIAETQVMACCWAIRQKHPDQQSFGAFVYETLHGTLTPAHAWRLADLWSIARKNQSMQQLVNSTPDRGVRFITEFARRLEVDRTDTGDPDLGPDERDIIELATKRRGKALREGLQKIAAERLAAREGRNADDVARIEELETRLDAATTTSSPAQRAAAAMKLFADQDAALVEVAREIKNLCAAGAFSEHMRQRLLRTADNTSSTVSVIADAIHEAADAL